MSTIFLICLFINMHCQVYFEITEDSKLDAACLLKKLEEHGVLVMPESSTRCVS